VVATAAVAGGTLLSAAGGFVWPEVKATTTKRKQIDGSNPSCHARLWGKRGFAAAIEIGILVKTQNIAMHDAALLNIAHFEKLK
jgi:hypothetical protein